VPLRPSRETTDSRHRLLLFITEITDADCGRSRPVSGVS